MSRLQADLLYFVSLTMKTSRHKTVNTDNSLLQTQLLFRVTFDICYFKFFLDFTYQPQFHPPLLLLPPHLPHNQPLIHSSERIRPRMGNLQSRAIFFQTTTLLSVYLWDWSDDWVRSEFSSHGLQPPITTPAAMLSLPWHCTP